MMREHGERRIEMRGKGKNRERERHLVHYTAKKALPPTNQLGCDCVFKMSPDVLFWKYDKAIQCNSLPMLINNSTRLHTRVN